MKGLFDDQYCRHGCNSCMQACPHHLPVSTIMRYAYYFEHQGREKEAIIKYKKGNGTLLKPVGGFKFKKSINTDEINLKERLKNGEDLESIFMTEGTGIDFAILEIDKNIVPYYQEIL